MLEHDIGVPAGHAACTAALRPTAPQVHPPPAKTYCIADSTTSVIFDIEFAIGVVMAKVSQWYLIEAQAQSVDALFCLQVQQA